MQVQLKTDTVRSEETVEDIMVDNSCKNSAQYCQGKKEEKYAVDGFNKIKSAEIDCAKKENTLENEIMGNYQEHLS